MFFPSTVTRHPYVSKDAHHKITWDMPETLSCKYAKISKKIENDTLITAWTSFPAGTSIHPDDKIVLPDGTFSKIVQIREINNHMGYPVCVEVYYGEESI